MLFDSHAHYNDERFKDDVDEVLSAMNENNVGLILNSCSSLDEVSDIFAICEKYPFVYASVGIHPHEVSELTEADMDKLKEYAKNPKVKAIGEIGLDYFYDFSPRDIQQKWFARQVDVARELKMPVVIHDREAHKDCMDILREHKVSEVGGVFHCYAGSVEMAKEILDWGMYIAFGGSLTFKKSAFKKYIIKIFRCTRKRFRRCRTCTDFKTAKNFYLIGIFYFTMLNIFIIYRKIFTD